MTYNVQCRHQVAKARNGLSVAASIIAVVQIAGSVPPSNSEPETGIPETGNNVRIVSQCTPRRAKTNCYIKEVPLFRRNSRKAFRSCQYGL